MDINISDQNFSYYNNDAIFEMQPICSPLYGNLKCFKLNGEEDTLWFIGKQVTTILGYRAGRNAINRHVNPKDIKYAMISNGVTKRKCLIINEVGLNALSRNSDMPAAKLFQDWLDREVLPSIRRTGIYRDTKGMMKWLSNRMFGKQVRDMMTNSYKFYACSQNDFAKLTNYEYQALFSHDAGDLKEFIGYSRKNCPNELLRDRLCQGALILIRELEGKMTELMVNQTFNEFSFASLLEEFRNKSIFWANPLAPVWRIPYNVNDSAIPRYPTTLEYFGVDLEERYNPLTFPYKFIDRSIIYSSVEDMYKLNGIVEDDVF